MSGLCGVVDFTGAPIEPEVLLPMAAVSRELGPHGTFPWHARGAALCHLAFHSTPQSITERQPLQTADGTVCLVADVRLDNRAELIERLAARDLAADGEPGDAALLLAAYLRWGTSCPEHLLGDFAFAIWDAPRQRLFCARDPLGVKPLHYSRSGQLVCFASESQQILQHPRIQRRLDEWTIADYLIDAWDDPERTFFRDVRRLPAAHRLLVTDRGACLERYWDVDQERQITYRDPREYTAHFLEIFERSVADRLSVPDGSVAVAMSGGLDSGSVAAVARRLLPRGRSPELFTCSFVFDSLRQCDERDYILGSAAHLGIDAELIDTEKFWFLSDSETVRPRLESPAIGMEPCFREMLARARSRGARALLTGNGGDEMMAGSPLVYLDRLLRGDLGVLVETGRHALRQGRSAGRVLYRYFGEPLIPAALDRRLRQVLGRASASEIPEWIRPELVARTHLAERLPSTYWPARHRRGAAWQELYDQVTRLRAWERSLLWYSSQANPFGIDVRHPFLDRRLAEFLLAIPPRQRAQPGCYKPLLRRSMEGILPDSVRQRSDKTSLRGFIDLALRHREQAKIEQILKAPIGVEMGFLDGDKLRATYTDYRRDESKQAHHLWYALSLELWLQEVVAPCLNTRKSSFSPHLMECRG